MIIVKDNLDTTYLEFMENVSSLTKIKKELVSLLVHKNHSYEEANTVFFISKCPFSSLLGVMDSVLTVLPI